MEEGPEPHEWVEKAADEHHHGAEHGASAAGREMTLSAITAAVLAVMAALASLLSGHEVNQAILKQTQATDQWAYFQAKSTKQQLYEVGGKLIEAPGAGESRRHRRSSSRRPQPVPAGARPLRSRKRRDQEGSRAPGSREPARVPQAPPVRPGHRLLPGGHRPGLRLHPGPSPGHLLPEPARGPGRADLGDHGAAGLKKTSLKGQRRRSPANLRRGEWFR